MTDSVATSWNRLVAWLGKHAPATIELIEGPPLPQQIEDAASRMNSPLSDDFRRFYEITNGAEESGIFPAHDEWDHMAYSPMSLDQIVADWEMQKELLEMGEFADCEPEGAEGIANDWWNVGWIPFASNGGGDYYCLDLAPTETGIRGQIISHSHESGEHVVLAPSLAEYLQTLADLVESNTLEYDDDYGLCKIEETE